MWAEPTGSHILACLLQTGSGSLSGITSEAGSDAAVPTSRELWFWSRFDFWNCRKSPSRVYRREHFTGERIETARINHELVLGGNNTSHHTCPFPGCFIVDKFDVHQNCQLSKS